MCFERHALEKSKNGKILVPILSNIRYLDQKALPLRGGDWTTDWTLKQSLRRTPIFIRCWNCGLKKIQRSLGRVWEIHIFTAKIATDLACAQRRYHCNTSGFSRQCYSGPQGSHLPIYANPLWFSVSFAKLRPSGPVLNFLPLPPPLRRRMHLSSISVLRPSASAKSRFP